MTYIMGFPVIIFVVAFIFIFSSIIRSGINKNSHYRDKFTHVNHSIHHTDQVNHNVKYCSDCGAQNNKGAFYCQQCGKELF